MFGQIPEAVDLRSSVRGYLEVLSLNGRAEDLIAFAGLRLMARQSELLSKVESFIEQMPTLSEELNTELQIFLDSLEAIALVKKRLGNKGAVSAKARQAVSSEHLVEAVYDDLDSEVVEWRQDQWQFDKEFCDLVEDDEHYRMEQVAHARSLFFSAINSSGVERGQLIREARTALINQTVVPNLAQSPSIWLHIAAISMATGGSISEVLPMLFRGMEDSKTEEKTAFTMSCRLASELLLRDGATDQAYEVLRRATGNVAAITVSMELAKCATLRGQAVEAIGHLEQAIRARPTSLLGVICDLECTPIVGTLMVTILQFQLQLRKEAFRAVDGWRVGARKMDELFKSCGTGLLLGTEILSGYKEAQETLAESNLFVSSRIKAAAEQNQTLMVTRALESAQNEYRRRLEAVNLARKLMEAAGEAREAEVRMAYGVQQNIILQVRKTLNINTGDSEQVQRGCLTGMGLSAALFAGYCGAVIVAGNHGTQIGVGTVGGTIAIIAAVIPSCLAMINQVGYGMRRITLEAELGKHSAVANRDYEAAVKQADARHKERIGGYRADLAVKEEDLAKIANCVKLLHSTE